MFLYQNESQWIYLFSMEFDDFSSIYPIFKYKSPFSIVKLSLSGYTIHSITFH